MAVFVQIDGDGMVIGAMTGRTAREGWVEVITTDTAPLPEGYMPVSVPITMQQAATGMLVDGWLAQRPQSPEPYVEAGQIVVPPCPAGTRIEIFDLTGRELMTEVIADTDDFEEVIGFSDPGTYEVEVHAPAPHLPTSTRITI